MPLYSTLPDQGVARFAHMPKTAGTWARQVLVTLAGGYDVGSGHDPAWFDDAANPQPLADTTWTILRGPEAWYSSLYAHARRLADGGQHPDVADALRTWGAGSIQWPDVLWGWTHPEDVPRLPDWLGVLWRPVPGVLLDREAGLWSWAARYYTRSADVVLWSDAADFVEAFARLHGLDVEAVRRTPRVNESRDRPVVTPSMLRWIQAADRTTLQR